MRTGKILSSALELCVAAGLIGAGAFLMALAYFPYLKAMVLHLFADHPELFSLLGFILLALGTLLFIGFYAMNRSQYYQVAMDQPKVSVDTNLLRTYADIYWQSLFPEHKVSTQVVLRHNQKLEFIAEMPPITLQEQEALLEKAEKELGAILARKFGYEREFFVTLLLKN